MFVNNLSINEISLNSNAREQWYSNTDCSRLPSAGGRLRSSSTHSRRRRRRRLSWGGGGGGGAKVPHRRGGAYGPGRVYGRTHATTRGSRLPPRADRVEYCGSSVQSTRQNGYSLLYDAHSVLSVRFLFAVLFHFVHFSLFSVFLGFASSVLLSDNRKLIGNCLSPHTVLIQRRAGENRNYYFYFLFFLLPFYSGQGWDESTRFMNEK